MKKKSKHSRSRSGMQLTQEINKTYAGEIELFAGKTVKDWCYCAVSFWGNMWGRRPEICLLLISLAEKHPNRTIIEDCSRLLEQQFL